MNSKILAIGVLLPFILMMLLYESTAQTKSTGRHLTEKLKPCHVTEVEEEVLCGHYDVYENRAARTGRKISLNIVILPAKTSDVADDPFVFLAGGGVAPATGYTSYFAKSFTDIRQHRDILLIDQRGSGGSNGLDCALSTDPADPDYRDEARYVQSVRRCRKELEQKADLRFYSTPIAMDDLDDVREWLGYPRINIYGVSYGTQAASVYLRQHPKSVRSLVLHGTVPLDLPMWLDYARNSQQALDQDFAICARQKACHDAFPNVSQEFNALLKRLEEKPVKIKVQNTETKQEVEVSIDAEILRVFVSRLLYSSERIHDLPLLIHLAYSGNYEPLAQKVVYFQGPGEIPKGVYFCIVCNEEWHFDPAGLPAAAANTFMGDFRLTRESQACAEWAHSSLPKDYWTPVKSDLPTLIMNGALDHATPPRYGERVAQSFTNSRRLVLPNRGHNDTDPCVAGIVQAFVTAGSSQNLDTSCLAKTEDLSFALRVEDLAN
jgi:Predicted hydrolases or acyltransferases (alpha/beta hydrolase superfamily)